MRFRRLFGARRPSLPFWLFPCRLSCRITVLATARFSRGAARDARRTWPGQRGEREKADQDRAHLSDLPRDDIGKESGKRADDRGSKPSLSDIRVEVDPAHAGQHPDQVGKEHAQTGDEDCRALHVQLAEAIEPRHGEPDTKQRDAERTGAENLPEPVPDVRPTGPVIGSGSRVRPTKRPSTSAVMAPSRRRESVLMRAPAPA